MDESQARKQQVNMAAAVTNAIPLPEGTLLELARRASLQIAKRNVDMRDLSYALLGAMQAMQLDGMESITALNRLLGLATALRDGQLPEYQAPGLGAVALPLPVALIAAAETCVMVGNDKNEVVFDIPQLKLLASTPAVPEPPRMAAGTRH